MEQTEMRSLVIVSVACSVLGAASFAGILYLANFTSVLPLDTADYASPIAATFFIVGAFVAGIGLIRARRAEISSAWVVSAAVALSVGLLGLLMIMVLNFLAYVLSNG